MKGRRKGGHRKRGVNKEKELKRSKKQGKEQKKTNDKMEEELETVPEVLREPKTCYHCCS